MKYLLAALIVFAIIAAIATPANAVTLKLYGKGNISDNGIYKDSAYPNDQTYGNGGCSATQKCTSNSSAREAGFTNATTRLGVGLFRVNTTLIPSNAIISKVNFSIWHNRWSSLAVNVVVKRLNSGWTEGLYCGQTGQSSFAKNTSTETWVSSIWSTNDTLEDFGQKVLGGTDYGRQEIILNATEFYGWINGSMINNGFAIWPYATTNSDAYNYEFTENGTLMFMPWVEIEYTLSSVPTVLIDSPASTNYHNVKNVSLVWSTTGFTLLNASYELDNVNYTITAIGGDFNTTITGLSDGNHNIRVYAQNSTNIYASSVVAFSVTKPVFVSINSPANNSIVTPPVVVMNVTYTSLELCNASWYSVDNGTNYSAMCASIFNITLTSGNHSITFYANNSVGRWNMTTINVSNFAPIVPCSQSGSFLALNFTYWNEETLVKTNASAEYALTVYYGNYNYTYNASESEANNFSVCTNAGPWIADIILKYTKPEHSTRWYFLSRASIGTSTNNIKLYVLNDSVDSTVSLTTQNAYGLPIENVYVSFQRYYIAENLYRTVAMAKSDNEGKSTVSLYTSNTWYKYVLVEDGVVMNTIGPSQITTTDLILPLSSSTVHTWEDYNSAITRSCAYSTTTKYLTCTFTMTSGLFTDVCLDVDQIGVLNNTDYSLSCLSTSSGTLMSNLSSVSSANQSVVYKLYGEGTWIPLEQGTIQLGFGIFFGGLGVFITAIMFCVCVGLGRWNPTVSLVFGYIGLWSCAAIGLIDIPLTAMGSLLITVLMYIYVVKT